MSSNKLSLPIVIVRRMLDSVCGCSTLTEFEEVTLKDSDDNDALEEDSYEEVSSSHVD